MTVESASENRASPVHSIDIEEGDTVLSVMRRLEKSGRLTFSGRERGGKMLVEQIGDVRNEGAGEKAKNWIYRVNGKKGITSCGEAKVAANDTILWRFEEWGAE